VVSFPDAPTERGAKHVREIIGSLKDGYIPCLLFVVQMIDVKYFEPARSIDPAFYEALKEAKEAGVNILAYSCNVTPDSLSLKDPVEVRIP
jgi:sugar fermentation stimulation protein A